MVAKFYEFFDFVFEIHALVVQLRGVIYDYVNLDASKKYMIFSQIEKLIG